MKIQIGKKYKTRSGRPVRIYATDGDECYPIHGAIHEGEGWHIQSWSQTGRVFDIGTRPNDIVEEENVS